MVTASVAVRRRKLHLDLSAELSEVRAEYKALVKTIKDTISSDTAQPSAEQDKKLQAELATMKKIIGNFHPRPDSPTYEELLNNLKACRDENEQLRRDQKQDAEQIKRLKGETDRLRQKVNQMVEANMQTPQKSSPRVQDPASPTQKVKHFFKRSYSRKAFQSNDKPSKQQVDYDNRRVAFMAAVKSPAYSDEQLTVIARAYDEDHINTEDFKNLLDPDISYDRLVFLFRLMSGKTDVSFPESGADDTASDSAFRKGKNAVPAEPHADARRTKVDSLILDSQPTSLGSDGLKTRAQAFARTLPERRSHHGR